MKIHQNEFHARNDVDHILMYKFCPLSKESCRNNCVCFSTGIGSAHINGKQYTALTPECSHFNRKFETVYFEIEEDTNED